MVPEVRVGTEDPTKLFTLCFEDTPDGPCCPSERVSELQILVLWSDLICSDLHLLVLPDKYALSSDY